MTLIANRQLCGDYGHVAAGAIFTAPNRVAESLIARGLARLSEEGEPPALRLLREAVAAADKPQRRRKPKGEKLPCSHVTSR